MELRQNICDDVPLRLLDLLLCNAVCLLLWLQFDSQITVIEFAQHYSLFTSSYLFGLGNKQIAAHVGKLDV